MLIPEQYRKDHPLLPLTPGDLDGGYFKIPHYDIANYYFLCTASAGQSWEHVAVILHSPKRKVNRCPTWLEMCHLKDLFWDKEEAIMQLHPPGSDWVSNHPYCLHLWRPLLADIPMPPSAMVGVK